MNWKSLKFCIIIILLDIFLYIFFCYLFQLHRVYLNRKYVRLKLIFTVLLLPSINIALFCDCLSPLFAFAFATFFAAAFDYSSCLASIFFFFT